MKKTEVCRMCSKEFPHPKKNQRYCCPECKQAAIAISAAKTRKKRKQKAEEKQRLATLSVTEINNLAKAAGMSYGKYVAEMEARKYG